MKQNLYFLNKFLFLIFLPLVAPLTLNAEKPDINIGFILPLSGDWAFLGNGIRDAALLAKEDLKNKKYKYNLLFEDNQGELKNSATIGQDLINVKKVDALVSIISGVGMLLNPMAERAKVINFGICSNTEVAKGRFNFLNYLTAKQGVQKFIKEINARYPKGLKLAVFAMNESGFSFIVEELIAKVKYSNIVVSSVNTYEPKTTDFRSQIIKASHETPEAVLILGLSPEIEIIAKQLKELGKSLPLVSIESFGLAENKTVFEGQWFVVAAVPSKEFQARFQKQYNRNITAGCGHAYDTLMLLAHAYESIGDGKNKPATGKVVEFLHKIDNYPGVLGQTSVDEEGIVYTEPSVKFILNGEVENVR